MTMQWGMMATMVMLTTMATAESGGRGRHKQLYMVPVPGEVTVDGRLDDWDLSGQIEMFVVEETRSTMSAKFSLMYDDEALYVGAEVRDPTPLMNRHDPQSRPAQAWDADACQFRLTLDLEAGYPVVGESSFKYRVSHPPEDTRDDIVHLLLWQYTEDGRPYLQMHKGMTYRIPHPDWLPQGLVPAEKFTAAYRQWGDGAGYTFEYRIPWATLGAERPLRGGGLKAEYFASTDFGGAPVVSRTDPRLWFYDNSVQSLIVAAWAANGPCEGIAAGKPFSARWTGSFIAPYSEPFWFRIYNARHGHPHAPNQQAWRDGKSFVRVWLNGQVILDKGRDSMRPNPWQTPPQTPPLMLQAGARYDLKVEYAYPGGTDAQFSLVWCSYTLEWMRVPTAYLYPDPAPSRPRVSVEAVQPVAREEGEQPGVVRFSLHAPHDRDIELRYRIGGTASAEDYRLDRDAVLIPAGETTAELVIRPADDDQVEANETAVVILTPSPEYAGDGTDGAAVVTIVDNDNILVDDDLVVYYTFDNASLARDDFGFATIRNDAGSVAALSVQSYLHAMPAFVPGLPGHGDGLTFPQGRTAVQSSGDLRLADFTVAFWFKAPEDAGTIGICQSAGTEFFLQDGAMVANQGGWYSRQPAGANLDDGQWHHVALIWNQADRQQQLNVDGVRVSTNHGPKGAGHSGMTRLGHATGGAFVGGVIDEYRIYRRPLTVNEVEALVNVTAD